MGSTKVECIQTEEGHRQSLRKHESVRGKLAGGAIQGDCAFVTKMRGKQRVLTAGMAEEENVSKGACEQQHVTRLRSPISLGLRGKRLS